MDTGFGNRDSLLFHSLVNSDLILDVHLIELIDAADSMVSQHQCSCLDAELSCLWILEDTSSQTSSAGSLTTGVN